MAKKDNENFDFETEGKAKVSFNLDFLKNLTKQQKGIILIAAVAVVLVIAIVITCIALGANSGNNGNDNSGGNSDGGNNGPINGELTTFYIASSPIKKIYYVGEFPDYTGLSIFVRGSYGGGTYIEYTDNPEDFTITGFDSSVVNDEVTITVEYAGVTDTFSIKVIEMPTVPPTLVSISIDPMPQTEYKVNDVFRFNGALIICEYSDGTTKAVKLKMSHLSGYSDAIGTPGEHEIKVIYFDEESSGYAETSFMITVTE